MNGLGQHQHTHHSGSWSLRLVPPFTWTAGGSPGSPASLCPCPSTVMAVRGVTPGLGLRRRLCRHTGHRRGPAPGDPAVTQIGEATWVGCSVRQLSPVVSLTGSGPRLLGRGLEGVPWSDVAIDPVAVNRLNHRCGCANTRSHGWSSGSLALTHHVLR